MKNDRFFEYEVINTQFSYGCRYNIPAMCPPYIAEAID